VMVVRNQSRVGTCPESVEGLLFSSFRIHHPSFFADD
jgi:hypothetical protein